MNCQRSPATTVCRDCGAGMNDAAPRCASCGSRLRVHHPELDTLAIAHLDCDAFYASVEKRDRPKLADHPVIVGGSTRGVVAACCYVARLYGVRSAMPMFKALAACPQAVVIRPDMRKYAEAGRAVRALMLELTPLVQPLSIDEAFLDLSGTERLHGGTPAQTLVRLQRRLEGELGITCSIGLSHNKFLAKIASDLDKPRGFAVIGRAETLDFLGPRPVSLIWGVGERLAARLAADGIRTTADLRRLDMTDLMARYGSMGRRLYHLSRGQDDRAVLPREPVKGISAETTFDSDIAALDQLERRLWPLCEKVARRAKAAGLGGQTVTLKLKTHSFRQFSRSRRLDAPTQLADRIFEAGRALLAPAADGSRFRLIGIGISDLGPARFADPPDLFDPARDRRARAERAMDAIRDKLGDGAIFKGRAFRPRQPRTS